MQRNLPRRLLLTCLVLVAAVAMTAQACSKKDDGAGSPQEAEQGAGAGSGGGGPLTDEAGNVILPSENDPSIPAPATPPSDNRAQPVDTAQQDDPHAGHGHGPGEHGAEPQGIPAPSDVAAAPADAQKTSTGLVTKVLQPGTGDSPGPNDVVRVHYTGWTTDGKMFDSSVTRGEPAEFPLGGVIAGWTEGLQLMKVGEKRRLWIPEELAYQGQPGRPAGMLVFDVELLEITQKAPKVPEDLAAPPADAQKTASGLTTRVLTPGKGGANPADGDSVKIHFSGWLGDGKMFDSTEMRGEPLTVPLERLWPGWKEGLSLMTVGEKRRLWIPADLAPPRPPGMDGPDTIVMDVELLDIVKPPAAPEDVAAPPADAEKTESGLASKVLQKGNGTVHPKATDTVEVHYTGWTTDGKVFDSSVMRGETAKFPLGGVIAGWTEGLQLMVEGEKRRLWIPEALAYGGRPGAPAGMLVFDVELVKIN